MLSIPSVVVERLPVYTRLLSRLEAEGQRVVSSDQLGKMVRATPAQIRKDLTYFGRFGKQGSGYDVVALNRELRSILGLTRQWHMVLVGVGNLGTAILSYQGFVSDGFVIVAAFDSNPDLVGKEVAGIQVRPVDALGAFLEGHAVEIGILALPPQAAQEVADALCAAGIKAILSYAPGRLQVPHDVQLREIDPVLGLRSMTYFLLKEIPRT